MKFQSDMYAANCSVKLKILGQSSPNFMKTEFLRVSKTSKAFPHLKFNIFLVNWPSNKELYVEISANPALVSQHSRCCWDTFHVQHSSDGRPALRVRGNTLVRRAVILLCSDDLQRSVLESEKTISFDCPWSVMLDPRREHFTYRSERMHSLSDSRCAS